MRFSIIFRYPAPPIGDWRHVKWYNLQLVQQTLEEMQQRVTSRLTPLPRLQITSSSGPSAGSTTPPPSGPSASSSQARPEVAQKAPPSWLPPRSGAMVVDPRASISNIRLHPLGLSRENGLINLIPPITVTRNTKTRLRTLMTPTNPLMGLSQVFLCLPWPPAPLVTLPRHPSDGCGVFHSAPPCHCTWADTSSSDIVEHFFSLTQRLIMVRLT